MIQTAIVGGGPAGAYCASCLTENDIFPTIFDPTHPREKPCGGLISPTAQELFPFLKQIQREHSVINNMNLISPKGIRTCFRLKKSFLAFSRLTLDKYLLDQAIKKGAELITEKVVAVKRKGNSWYLKTEKKTYVTKILIGADGVNSLVREKIIGPFNRNDVSLCFGYFLNDPEVKDITIAFSPYRKGYIWVIPRGRNTSFGIWSTEVSGSCSLKRELDMFIEINYPDFKKISSWAASIPNVKDLKTFAKPLAGKNWVLLGDAAGHVNPITGEGILYALADGELAAQAIADNSPNQFNNLWMENFRMNLFSAIKMRKWQYRKTILELYCQSYKIRV